MIQKSYADQASLYLIPTPIGNLEDMTLRAIETLKQVEVVFSEDTRVTSLLMNHLGIKKKLISSYNFNEEKNEKKLLTYLENGKSVGVVSDRGTPVISDPGYELAKIAIAHGYPVIGLPGATALIPALIMSGLEPLPFYFYGFLNSKESHRKEELKSLSSFPHTIIFYEAPHRIEKTLNQMLEILGDRKICIAREISKKFETIYRGNISELLEYTETMKGEIVLLVEGNKDEKDYTHLTVVEHVNLYIKEGFSSKDAIKKVSKDRNVTKKEIYDIYHQIDRK
ncbi:MAG: 16S rRNA (cytidine(1402)-2'-O)-methyltransferase [Firmicutes bacterium]|nr:16S rRNA (cytidine(1402)-2'-O)-methyltransferase [Bacillota bacterium]